MNIVISNIEIKQKDNLYRLNDFHKASGAEKRHQPKEFLRLQSTNELVEELKSDVGIPLSVIKGGKNQGTYVCKELIYSYAMWISAKFHLAVIKVFDNHVNNNQIHKFSRIELLEMNLANERRLLEAKPKLDFYNQVAERDNNLNATQTAESLGFKSAQDLNKYLDSIGGIYDKRINRGRTFQSSFVDKGYGKNIITESGHTQSLFTPKGLTYIHELLSEVV